MEKCNTKTLKIMTSTIQKNMDVAIEDVVVRGEQFYKRNTVTNQGLSSSEVVC